MTFFVRGVDMGSTFVVSMSWWQFLFRKTLQDPGNTFYNHHLPFWRSNSHIFKILIIRFHKYRKLCCKKALKNTPVGNIALFAIFGLFCTKIAQYGDIGNISILKLEQTFNQKSIWWLYEVLAGYLRVFWNKCLHCIMLTTNVEPITTSLTKI